MHHEAFEFVKSVRDMSPSRFSGKPPNFGVLEVGSRYINGTVRTLFDGMSYLGIDLSPGPCVDVVAHATDIDAIKGAFTWDKRYFSVVISCEALEHDKRYAESIRAMYDLLAPGGLLIITAGGTGRPEHGTTRTSPSDSPDTTDYYGNITPELFRAALQGRTFSQSEIRDVGGDFQFWGIK